MTVDEKIQILIEAIRFGLEKEVQEITPKTKFGDLGIDSLDAIELQMWLEDHKNLTVADPKGAIKTVEDFLILLP